MKDEFLIHQRAKPAFKAWQAETFRVTCHVSPACRADLSRRSRAKAEAGEGVQSRVITELLYGEILG